MFTVKQNKTKQNPFHPFDDLQLWALFISRGSDTASIQLQKLPRSKLWLILFHIMFFIYFFMLCDRWRLKALVLLLMFPAGLLIFLSSLISDPQFSSISQLMPLLAWLHLSSVAPVATTCWGTALWVLSRKAVCFIDSDFNFKC